MMESLIQQGHFTPSEMREMAVLASTHYEMRRVYNVPGSAPSSVLEALEIVSAWRKQVEG